jgi:enoyl-CoA hydratase/carnithine racemase
MEEVELSVQGEVALLQLRRPAHGNALRGTMFDALRRVALRMADAPPGFVVLVGEGADFCTGLERDPTDALWALFEPMARARDAHRAQELITRMRSAFDAIARLPCPVLAAIEGRCHGAGAELALLADLRIVGAGATLTLTEGHDGVLTGFGGLVRATLLLGPGRAAELALLGEAITADDALRIGLASRIVDDGAALSGALEAVQALRRTSPAARLQTILALRTLATRQAQDLFDAETQAAARTWIATDWQSALAARRAGREPSW